MAEQDTATADGLLPILPCAESDPADFCLARAVGRIDEIEEWLQRIDRSSFTAPAPGLATTIEGAAAQMRSMYRLGIGDVPGAIAQARHARELEPVADAPTHAAAGYYLGVALFWDDPDQAVPLLREFLDATPDDAQDPRHRYAMALLVEAHALRGELDAADRLARTAMERTQHFNLEEFPSATQLHIARAMAPLAHGELYTAEEHFERAVALARRAGDRVEVAHTLLSDTLVGDRGVVWRHAAW